MTSVHTPAGLRRVPGRAELLAAVDDDYLRWNLRDGSRGVGWVSDAGPAAAWTWLGGRRGAWTAAVGPPEPAASLTAVAVAEAPVATAGVTVPIDALPLLPPAARPDPAATNAWEWMRTYAAPPRQPHERAVTWLDVPTGELAGFLAGHSGRHSANPGDEHVRRWCGIADADGLAAVAAHVEYIPGVPHLAAITVRADRRGQGLGAAVTAWLTRRCLAEGAPVVTLGMYSDNAVARRLYARLGFSCQHAFASGPLRPAVPADAAGPSLR